MSCNWPIVKLGDYCSKVGSGATPKGGNSVYLDHGEISLIRSQNIYNEGFKSDGLVYITPEAAQKLKNVIIEPNDVLINITGDSVARVCLAPNEFLPARVNQHVAILRVDPEEFDHRYLRYFLTSTKMQNYLLTIASTGGTRNALTKSMLESLEVSKPSLDVQKRIGDVLESFESKIELNSRTNQTLEQMAQAIFKSWFVDFDPVIAKINGEQLEEMDAATASLFPEKLVEFELGLIPEGWDIKPLEDICSTITDGAHKSPKSIDCGGYPMASVKDMDEFSFNLDKCRRISESDYQSLVSSKCRPEIGDVLIAKDGSYLKHIFVLKEAVDVALLSSIAIARPSNIISSNYICLTLKQSNTKYRLENIVSGAVIQRIVLKDFRKFKVLYPPVEILECFEEKISSIYQLIHQNLKNSYTLTKLRDTLLPKLLSGEIELKESAAVDENDVVNLLLKQMDFGVKSKPRKSSIPNGHIGYITTSGTFGSDGGTFVDIPKAVQALTKITSADGTYGEIAGNALTENVLSGTVELATNNIIPLGVLTKICTAVFGKKTPIKPRNAVLLTSIHQAKNKTLDSIMNEQAKRFKFLEQSSMDEQEFGESLRYLESIGVVKCEGQHITLLDTIVQH
ncbi:restriction endonuclease subunit S [Vibrio campbellii]|uniref:restriction endonuclease subunit S n=1 Tax=Vibrio campbellii TaxID=680 RepID=UPI0038CD28D6